MDSRENIPGLEYLWRTYSGPTMGLVCLYAAYRVVSMRADRYARCGKYHANEKNVTG